MLFNNYKNYDSKQRFSIRKLSVGVCSVLLSTLFLATTTVRSVHAEQKVDLGTDSEAKTDQTAKVASDDEQSKLKIETDSSNNSTASTRDETKTALQQSGEEQNNKKKDESSAADTLFNKEQDPATNEKTAAKDNTAGANLATKKSEEPAKTENSAAKDKAAKSQADLSKAPVAGKGDALAESKVRTENNTQNWSNHRYILTWDGKPRTDSDWNDVIKSQVMPYVIAADKNTGATFDSWTWTAGPTVSGSNVGTNYVGFPNGTLTVKNSNGTKTTYNNVTINMASSIAEYFRYKLGITTNTDSPDNNNSNVKQFVTVVTHALHDNSVPDADRDLAINKDDVKALVVPGYTYTNDNNYISKELLASAGWSTSHQTAADPNNETREAHGGVLLTFTDGSTLTIGPANLKIIKPMPAGSDENPVQIPYITTGNANMGIANANSDYSVPIAGNNNTINPNISVSANFNDLFKPTYTWLANTDSNGDPIDYDSIVSSNNGDLTQSAAINEITKHVLAADQIKSMNENGGKVTLNVLVQYHDPVSGNNDGYQIIPVTVNITKDSITDAQKDNIINAIDHITSHPITDHDFGNNGLDSKTWGIDPAQIVWRSGTSQEQINEYKSLIKDLAATNLHNFPDSTDIGTNENGKYHVVVPGLTITFVDNTTKEFSTNAWIYKPENANKLDNNFITGNANQFSSANAENNVTNLAKNALVSFDQSYQWVIQDTAGSIDFNGQTITGYRAITAGDVKNAGTLSNTYVLVGYTKNAQSGTSGTYDGYYAVNVPVTLTGKIKIGLSGNSTQTTTYNGKAFGEAGNIDLSQIKPKFTDTNTGDEITDLTNPGTNDTNLTAEDFTFKQGTTEITNPTNVGTYDVYINSNGLAKLEKWANGKYYDWSEAEKATPIKIGTFTINSKVTFEFVDDDNKDAQGNPTVVGTPQSQGMPIGIEATINPELTVPKNYLLATSQPDIILNGGKLPLTYTVATGTNEKTVEIHLVHKTQDVTATDENAKESRQITVHYVYGNGANKGQNAANDAVLDIYYHRTATKDLVTNKVTYGNWQFGNTFNGKYKNNVYKNGYHVVSGKWTNLPTSWDNVIADVPTVAGYKPFKNGDWTTNANGSQSTVPANKFVYPTYTNAGTSTEGGNPIAYTSDADTYEAKSEHTIYYVQNVQQTRTVTEHYRYWRDGHDYGQAEPDAVIEVYFENVPTGFKTNGSTDPSKWTPILGDWQWNKNEGNANTPGFRVVKGTWSNISANGERISFAADTPDITGYTKVSLDNTADINSFSFYRPDKTSNLNTLFTSDSSSDWLARKSLTTFYVPTSTLSKEVKRTINVVDPDTGKVTTLTVQTVDFNRLARVDQGDGNIDSPDGPKVIYGAQIDNDPYHFVAGDDLWNHNTGQANASGTWPTHNVAKAGYTALVDGVKVNDNEVPSATVTPDSSDKTITVTYTANEQSVTINFEDNDENDKLVDSTTESGTTDQTITKFDNAQRKLAELEAKGYKLAEGATIPTSYTFKASDNGPIVIKLVHNTTEIGQATDKGSNISGTSATLQDAITDTDVNKAVTRTIYVTKPGESSSTVAATQTVNFKQSAIVDMVTGQVTGYTGWQNADANTTWAAFTPETVTGYTPVIKIDGTVQNSVGEVTPTVTTANSTVDITYTASSTATLSGSASSTYTGLPITFNDVNSTAAGNNIKVNVTGPNSGSYTLQQGDVEFSSDNGQTWSTTLPTNAGTYQVRLTDQAKSNIKNQFGNNSIIWGTDDANISGSATYTIKKADITVSGNGTQSADYDGTAFGKDASGDVTGLDLSKFAPTLSAGTTEKPITTPTIPANTLTANDFTIENQDGTVNANPTTAGTYNVYLNANGIAKLQQLTGASNFNWPADPVKVGSFTINPVSITATISSSTGRTYDGKTTTNSDLNAVASITVPGLTAPVTYTLVDGDYTWNTTDNAAPINASDTAYTITLTNAGIQHLQDAINAKIGKGNVTIADTGITNNVSYTISKATVTVTLSGNNNSSKPTYNGSAVSAPVSDLQHAMSGTGLDFSKLTAADFDWYATQECDNHYFGSN